MQGLRWLQMTPDEIEDVLGRGGTGVISFGAGQDASPAAIPVSYGYDPAEGAFFFRLSVAPERRKTALVDRPVTFVVYDETDSGWQSVVAVGTLTDLAELPPESSAAQGMWAIRIPEVDIFEQPREDVEFRDFRLDLERIDGRKEVQTVPD